MELFEYIKSWSGTGIYTLFWHILSIPGFCARQLNVKNDGMKNPRVILLLILNNIAFNKLQ